MHNQMKRAHNQMERAHRDDCGTNWFCANGSINVPSIQVSTLVVKSILFGFIKDNWYDSYSEYFKNSSQIADTSYSVKVTHGSNLPFVQLFASEKTHARTHNTLVTITIRCFWYFSNLLFLLKRSSPNFASNIWRSFRQINSVTPEIIRNVWK